MWIFKFFNSNVIHNFLNLLIGINGIVLWAGCSVDASGTASCAQSFIPPSIALAIIAISAPLKLIINIVRDGFPGMFKSQPPVADSMTTVVTPVTTVVRPVKVVTKMPATTSATRTPSRSR